MAQLKINGKEYEIKFTYMAVLTLEKAFGMGIGKVFKDMDLENIGVLNTFVYACLKRHADFKTATQEDIAIALDEAFENEDITFEQLAEAIKDAVENSVIVKQGNGKKQKGK